MNPAIKETAELLRLKLLLGLVTLPEVIHWADGVIETEVNLEEELIEISLSRTVKVNEMMTLLSEVKGDFERPPVFRRLLKNLLQRLESDSSQGRKIALQLYMLSHELEECGFGTAAYALDEGFDGYCTEEHSLNQLLGFLKEFAEDKTSSPTLSNKQMPDPHD